MPELPEVETVARGLRAVLPGRRILSVRLSTKTNFIEDPSALEMHLPGRTVSGIRRHGKLLLVDFDPSDSATEPVALTIHLGMTGQIVVGAADAPVVPHTHVFLALDDGREFRYTDVRRFGKMRLVAAGAPAATRATTLGADSLAITPAEFRELVHSRRSRIKALLMDQGALSGMGNIYTDEALWRARIHPKRLGANLTPEEIARLYKEVRAVLNEAIRLKGSSVSDYVDTEGNRGEFQTHHRVYQRGGEACFRCRAKIRRIIVAGRSTHFCPQCQPAPRTRSRVKAKGATSAGARRSAKPSARQASRKTKSKSRRAA
ncbi:MAG: bifunctional DNA-formamidopyrimidine glycosylase/DNA-(apurinic or apyrimidinic site) lyase [Candidatus Acidiferrales bacterium]